MLKKALLGKADNLVIEQKFNQLFFLPSNPKLESKLVNRLMKKTEKHVDRVGLHASAIIVSENQFCYRQQVLSLLYKQSQGDEVAPGLKRIFEEGNFIHEKWQRLFLRGNLCEVNDLDRSRFHALYELSYTPDAIIKIGKDEYVVEIKSMNTFQFTKVNDHPTAPKQLQFYMHLTGISKGIVLMEDKNTQNFKVTIHNYEYSEVEDFEERLINIQEMKEVFVEEKKPPKRICKDCNTKRAKDCNMRDACFNVGMGRVKLGVK